MNDANQVLETLNMQEKEVQTKDGHWFKLKILPYRTVENVINGVVLTFSDIDEQKRVSLEAQGDRDYAESIVNTVMEPLLVLTKDLIVRSANTTFYEHLGTTPDEIRGRTLKQIQGGMWNIPKLLSRLNDLTNKEKELENVSIELTFPRIGKKEVDVTARKLRTSEGKSTTLLLTINPK